MFVLHDGRLKKLGIAWAVTPMRDRPGEWLRPYGISARFGGSWFGLMVDIYNLSYSLDMISFGISATVKLDALIRLKRDLLSFDDQP
jgi:hypothetical protein